MEKKLKLRPHEIDRINDYANVFSTEAGKRVLDDLEISFGGLCYTKGDSHDTAFKEGQREVLMRIKGFLDYLKYELEIEEEEENKEI